MTDNEIMQALLRHLTDAQKCGSITLYKEEMVGLCDLINRQKAEIAKKDTEIDILIRKKEALRDEIAEKDAEIERLKEEVEHFKLKNSELFKLNKNVADAAESLQADKIIAQRHEKDARELYKQAVLQLKTVKSEAYREFAKEFVDDLSHMLTYDKDYIKAKIFKLLESKQKELTESNE